MHHPRRGAVLALLLAVLPVVPAVVLPAAAQPACTAANAGARICMVGQACTCAYHRGGQLTATPPGWRWSCSLLETCDPPPPATLDEGQPSYPMLIEPNVQWNQGGAAPGPRY